jgi:hypothetical protein
MHFAHKLLSDDIEQNQGSSLRGREVSLRMAAVNLAMKTELTHYQNFDNPRTAELK